MAVNSSLINNSNFHLLNNSNLDSLNLNYNSQHQSQSHSNPNSYSCSRVNSSISSSSPLPSSSSSSIISTSVKNKNKNKNSKKDKKSNTNNNNSSSEVNNIMTNTQPSLSASPNYSSIPISGSSSIMTTASNTIITGTATGKLPGEVPEALQVNGTTPSGKPRLFVCSTCTRAFARQEHLKRHERSHTKEKPFSCGVCSRKFSRRDLLLRHAQKLHAGCSDTAITRLRKKSIRRSSTSSSIGSTPMNHNNSTNDDSVSSTIRSKKMTRGSISGASSSMNNNSINNHTNNNSGFSTGSISKPRASSISNLKNSNKIETIKTILENKTEEPTQTYNNNHNLNNMGGHNSISPSSSLSSNFVVENQFNMGPNDSKNTYNNFNNANGNSNGNANGNGNNHVATNNSSNNNLQQFNEDVLTDLPFLRNHLPMNRRASFSAMSGNNYATSFNQPYASETVEFATPQMMPMDDAENWLNNLDEIPSLDFINPNFQQRQHDQQQQQQQNQQQQKYQLQQQQQFQNQIQIQQTQMKNESPAEAISGYSFYDVPSKNVESLFSHSNRMPNSNNNGNNNSNINNSSNLTQNMLNNHLNSLLLSPLLHDSPDIDSSPSSQTQVWSNFNNGNNGRQHSKLANNSNGNKIDNDNKNSKSKVHNFNNDINELELLTDLNASRDYNLPAGYSFYGSTDIQSNLNNNSSCSSSNATISPILLDNAYGNSSTISNQPPNNLNSNSSFNSPFSRPNTTSQQQQTLPQQHHHHQNHHQQQQNPYNDQQQQLNSEVKNIPNNISNNFEKYSTKLLFTNLIRNCIHFSLSKYPFIGLQNPTIPDNDKLNFYSQVFEEKFLLHHPFIHKSYLNEFSLIKTTLKNINTNKLNDLANSNGNINASGTSDYIKVSLICFPLLVATIGAVYCNRKADAANLYEASRRSIHVYLDFRKRQQQQMQNQGNGEAPQLNDNSSPLWLIQSLTLSIIYGLFADNDICLNVIIRQVNALNSLLKSSGLTMISWNYDSNKNIDDKYFENYIQYESTVRTIHTIFHITAMLSSLYNIVPSLKVDELFIDLPVNSIVWNTNNTNEFKQVFMTFIHSKPEKFSKILGDLLEFPFNSFHSSSISPGSSSHSSSSYHSTRSLSVKNFLVDNQISEFGLNCLLNGLHQYNYFQQLAESNDANNNNNINNNNDNNNTGIHNNSNIDANLLDKLSNSQKYSSVSNNHINQFSNTIHEVRSIRVDTRIQDIINSWDNMISGSSIYDQKSELVNDCKILNHYLSIKSSGIISLNRVKESVWLKSWNDMCELYYNTYKFKEADILRDNTLSDNLRDVVGHSVDILKLVFFKKINKSSSISSLSSSVGDSKIGEAVNSLTLNEDQLKEITDENLGELDFEHFSKHLSIDLQILFDVFLVLVKFLITFERNSKIKMRYNNLNSNINFVHHFELQSNILPFNYNSNSAINGPIPGLSENLSSISLNGNSGKDGHIGNDEDGDEAARSKQNDLEFFKLYKLIFKLFLNLEFFLKVNYGYHDFESEFANLTVSSIVNKYKTKDINIGIDSNINKFVDSNNFDKLNSSKLPNNTSDEDLSSRDRDLIINELINFKLPFKLLKIGEFLFSFLYDKNIKFVNFKNLSSGLFHLRIFLENREEYFE